MADIAVLIAAYNAEKTINRTIRSLNAGTEPHDIIIADDGSNTPVSNFITPQQNLTILRSETNRGQAKARNMGLEYILLKPYIYVYIIDSDDTSERKSLKLHRTFLDEHPDVGVVGSWIRYVNENEETLSYVKLPTDHKDIVIGMFYNNCLQFGMYRTEALRKLGTYRPYIAEDYDLTRRVIHRYKAANIPYFLYNYTISLNGITSTRTLRQKLSLLALQWIHRDFSSVHFYVGIFRTLARLALLPFIKARAFPQSVNGKPPVITWHYLHGQTVQSDE